MKVTTSRKPSPPTRRLAKALADYLGLPYETRGKSSLDTDVVWMVLVENHGNPVGMIRLSGEERRTLRFTLLAVEWAQRLKRRTPFVVGPAEDAAPVADFFGLAWHSESEAGRSIWLTADQMIFKDGEDTIIRLKRHEGPCISDAGDGRS